MLLLLIHEVAPIFMCEHLPTGGVGEGARGAIGAETEDLVVPQKPSVLPRGRRHLQPSQAPPRVPAPGDGARARVDQSASGRYTLFPLAANSFDF